MLAVKPANQALRLQAIRRFELGQNVHSGKMDNLVDLAAQITDCPIALVSIVHDDAQRFEASCGLSLSGTGLESSICSHAILQDDLLEVPDCRLDPRTSDNPLVVDPDDPMIFYAGGQIRTAEGVTLGSLCVLDRKPRTLDETQRNALRILADQAMRMLELHDAVRTADNLRREADHRVKNSLAGIAAVARMSAARSTSDETRDALRVVQGRIEAIAKLHAELYSQNEGEGHIEASDYLGRICGHLVQMSAPGVAIAYDFAPLRLSNSAAGSLGLILNEMVSNALKHGFPEGRTGTVTVAGERLPSGVYRMSCTDDGCGSEALSDGVGLGGRLMDASALQLGGKVEASPVADGSGYTVSITFETAEA